VSRILSKEDLTSSSPTISERFMKSGIRIAV
jgi:hypothetical protein